MADGDHARPCRTPAEIAAEEAEVKRADAAFWRTMARKTRRELAAWWSATETTMRRLGVSEEALAGRKRYASERIAEARKGERDGA